MRSCAFFAFLILVSRELLASPCPRFESPADLFDMMDQAKAADVTYTASTEQRGAVVIYAKFEGQSPQDTLGRLCSPERWL